MYLCDGEKEGCEKRHCYKNTKEDPCGHTKDINHAVNFNKFIHGRSEYYWETGCDESSATGADFKEGKNQTKEVTWVNKVDQTIDKICDYIQRELDEGEAYGNRTQETIKALAMLVEARAQELKAIRNSMECEQENYIPLSRK